MDWKGVDEHLTRRGELLLNLDFLEGYDAELRLLTILILAAHLSLLVGMLSFLILRYILSMFYKQLEGFSKALNILVPRLH